MRDRLEMLAAKWDSADYAIEQVNNPLLPQEQCAIELREVIKFYCDDYDALVRDAMQWRKQQGQSR